jgi:hypothetical protein
MSKHIAVVHIPFEINDPAETDPSAEADMIVRDIMSHGFGDANLDDVLDVEEEPKYLFPVFSKKALECGHGDNFNCVFSIRVFGKNKYCIESVDVEMVYDESERLPARVGIGGVGGELIFDYSDGRAPYSVEQMCRDWVGRWHREFVGKTEDSVLGMFYIIRQIVAEGSFSNS